LRNLPLDKWASLAEIVSAVAVVISLIYVGYQINENTGEIRAANRQQLVDRAHEATMSFATSTDLADVMAKASVGAELSLSEQSQYEYAVRAVLYDVQEAFLLHREGRLDEGYWQTRQALILAYISTQTGYDVYQQNKSRGILHRDFVEWLDRALEDE
jgi:hypothetical protein